MTELLGGTPAFDDLRIPFASVATYVKHGRRAVLREGDVASAVIASAAMPLITKPVETPVFARGISWVSFDRADDLVDAGHDAMRRTLPSLLDLL